jgi:hypothetical protein
MNRTSIDEGFDVGCMKLYEAVIQTSRREGNGANSFKGLDIGPLSLVSGFMFLSPTSLCHGEFTLDVLLHMISLTTYVTPRTLVSSISLLVDEEVELASLRES